MRDHRPLHVADNHVRRVPEEQDEGEEAAGKGEAPNARDETQEKRKRQEEESQKDKHAQNAKEPSREM